MMNISAPATLRARAWEAFKATWPIVLAGSALIQLVSFVLNQIVGAIPVIGVFLTFLVAALMTVPMMGLTRGVLGYYRGKPMAQDCVTSMFPHWKQVCVLYLWTMLCTLGWIAIGAIPMTVGAVLMPFESMGFIGVVLMLGGVVLILVLGTRAALNYSMSQCILVDDANVGARNALNRSKEMISGYRWHYVKVGLPVFGLIFVAVIIIGALTAVLPAWLSSLISSVMSTFTGMLGYYFMPVMYEELKRIGR